MKERLTALEQGQRFPEDILHYVLSMIREYYYTESHSLPSNIIS